MFSRFADADQRKKLGMGTPKPARAGPDGQPTERNQMPIRWVILFLTCTLMIGNYYCYDNPSALKEQIYERFKEDMTKAEYESNFSLLYSLYSFPNVVLPFLGGVLVDRIGARTALLLFGCFICLGQVLLALGCSSKSFTLMLVGRMVFGFGGESLTVAGSSIVSLWFKGRELAFALGVNLSIARLGGTVNNQLSPYWASERGITFALWFGVAMCLASIAATLLLIPIDLAAEKRSQRGKTPTPPGEEPEPVKLSDVRHFGRMLWLLTASCVVVYGCVLPFNNTASSFLLERDFFRPPAHPFPTRDGGSGLWVCPEGETCCTGAFPIPPDQRRGAFAGPGVCSPPAEGGGGGGGGGGTPFQPVLGNLTAASIDCSAEDGSYGVPAEGAGGPGWRSQEVAAAAAYCAQKAEAEAQAAVVMSIPYFISAVISPFLGLLVDRLGKRAVVAALAPALLVVVHLSLGLVDAAALPGMYPLMGQGLAYSAFAAALWPSVPYVVDEHLVGTAYGVITAVQNLGLAVFPMGAAAIYDASGDSYLPNVEFMFAGMAAVGLAIGVGLNVEDPKHGSPMNRVHGAPASGRGGGGAAATGAISYSMEQPLIAADDEASVLEGGGADGH
jgi:MFS family permease